MRNGHDVQISIVRAPHGAGTMPVALMTPATYRRPGGERAYTLITSALLVLSTGVACFDLHVLLKFAAA
jgi:hypothetical protein